MKNSLTLEQVFEDVGLTAKWEARGRVEGEARGRTEIAQKMKNAGKPLVEIREFTGLSPEDIARL